MTIYVLVAYWVLQGGGATVQNAFTTKKVCEVELTIQAMVAIENGIKGIRLKCEPTEVKQ